MSGAKISRRDIRVLLFSACGGPRPFMVGRGGNSLTLETVRQGLHDRELYDVEVFPLHRCNLMAPMEVGWLGRTIGDHAKGKPVIVAAISSTSPAYVQQALPLARIVREAVPEAIIFGGGAHAREENPLVDFRGRHRGAIELWLNERDAHGRPLFDYVSVGGAGSFTAFLVDGMEFDLAKYPGLYRLGERGMVEGAGRSPAPLLSRVPFLQMFNETGPGEYHVLFNPACPHGCDFCSVDGKTVHFTPEQKMLVARRLAAKFGEYGGRIVFLDPNPLAGLVGTREFLQIINESGLGRTQIEKGVSVDPGVLIREMQNDSLEAFAQMMVFAGFNGFFVGRDGLFVSRLGRRSFRELKTQALLEAEREAIFKFAEALKIARKKMSWPPFCGDKPQIFLTVSNILRPDETRETALALFGEMRQMRNASGGGVMVSPKVEHLRPYPGTRLQENCSADMVDPENMRLLVDTANPWSERLGAGSALIDHFLEWAYGEEGKEEGGAGAISKPIADAEDLASRIFDGKLLPVPDAEKEALATKMAEDAEKARLAREAAARAQEHIREFVWAGLRRAREQESPLVLDLTGADR